MSTTTSIIPVTLAVSEPRGARWAAAIAARLWLALARPTPPRPAPVRNRAQEAAALREYAAGVARHDPRYAADLFAAADRHERDDG